MLYKFSDPLLSVVLTKSGKKKEQHENKQEQRTALPKTMKQSAVSSRVHTAIRRMPRLNALRPSVKNPTERQVLTFNQSIFCLRSKALFSSFNCLLFSSNSFIRRSYSSISFSNAFADVLFSSFTSVKK